MRRKLVVLLAFGALAAGATASRAYVRSTTSTGTPISWRERCREVLVDSTENPEFSHDRLLRVVQRAVANWVEPTKECTEVAITIGIHTIDGADVAYDGDNVLLWRLPGFCDDPDNADAEVCLAPNAAAITTIFYFDKPGEPDDGELLEADLVINAGGFRFADDGAPGLLDLEGVMTHELGHFLGLGHTCYTARGAAPPVDVRGREVPFCFPMTTLDADTTAATMFNFVAAGETHKRDPLQNELQGICEIYATTPGECFTPDVGGCGCRATAERARPAGWVVLAMIGLALVCLVRPRIKRRRR